MNTSVDRQKNPSIHEVLRHLPYGLYVAGFTNLEGKMNAIVVSWVTQCSFHPPMLMIAVRRPSHSYDLIQDSRAFTVNLIDKKDSVLVRKLVRPYDRVGDKLGRVSHVAEDTGAPILRKAFAFIECRIRARYEPGDHAIVIGEVIHAGLQHPGDALMCADLRWHYAG